MRTETLWTGMISEEYGFRCGPVPEIYEFKVTREGGICFVQQNKGPTGLVTLNVEPITGKVKLKTGDVIETPDKWVRYVLQEHQSAVGIEIPVRQDLEEIDPEDDLRTLPTPGWF
ncbi:MAG: hypothetical protein ABIJ92_00745 [Candidatus Aenigmatarchaeota archaeon]